MERTYAARSPSDSFDPVRTIASRSFEAVRIFEPLDRAAVAELLSRSRPYALEGRYELFKTSATFDGTAKHSAWLGDDVEAVQKLAPVME